MSFKSLVPPKLITAQAVSGSAGSARMANVVGFYSAVSPKTSLIRTSKKESGVGLEGGREEVVYWGLRSPRRGSKAVPVRLGATS